MSHFLRPLLATQAVQLVNDRTGALVAAMLETAFDSATRRRGLVGPGDLAEGRPSPRLSFEQDPSTIAI